MRIVYREQEGSTGVALQLAGADVSRAAVIPCLMRVGEAVVRADGIGGVETEPGYQGRGYGRRVMEAAMRRMREGDAALAIVWGIPDYYEKFGYATAGPEYSMVLYAEGGPIGTEIPTGWAVRPFAVSDLASVHRLYEVASAGAVGPLVRVPGSPAPHGVDSPAWSQLLSRAGEDVCRVLIDPGGDVAAYAWLARGAWWAPYRPRAAPEALLFAEVVAGGHAAADAILSVCTLWASEFGRSRIEIPTPPEGPIAAAAMLRGGGFTACYSRSGAFMCRLLDVRRLLEQMLPELGLRVLRSGHGFRGMFRIETEEGAASLWASRDGLSLSDDPDPAPALSVRLPQHQLARLALGAFPPRDLLARLPDPPRATSADLLAALFPPRHPHPYPANTF